MEKTAFLYKVTNKMNGMSYIGVTVNPKKRWASHCRSVGNSRLLLKNAILKHGADNFEMQLLCKAPQVFCYELEQKAIAVYNTLKPNGYNLSAGGLGSLGLIGKQNGCFGRTGEKHPNFGKPGYRTGMLHTSETKEKMSVSRVGKKHSLETIEKIRESSKTRFSDLNERQRMKELGFGIGRPRTTRVKP
jgi:group I intron endonuclease